MSEYLELRLSNSNTITGWAQDAKASLKEWDGNYAEDLEIQCLAHRLIKVLTDLAISSQRLTDAININIDQHREIVELRAEIARRDEIITRLKEAGEHMYFTSGDDPYQTQNRVHEAWRALMKELE